MTVEKTKPLRTAMPQVAAWIDSLRAAFGPAGIDSAIRNGIAGLPHFHACEGGQHIGTPLPAAVVEFNGATLTQHIVAGRP